VAGRRQTQALLQSCGERTGALCVQCWAAPCSKLGALSSPAGLAWLGRRNNGMQACSKPAGKSAANQLQLCSSAALQQVANLSRSLFTIELQRRALVCPQPRPMFG